MSWLLSVSCCVCDPGIDAGDSNGIPPGWRAGNARFVTGAPSAVGLRGSVAPRRTHIRDLPASYGGVESYPFKVPSGELDALRKKRLLQRECPASTGEIFAGLPAKPTTQYFGRLIAGKRCVPSRVEPPKVIEATRFSDIVIHIDIRRYLSSEWLQKASHFGSVPVQQLSCKVLLPLPPELS